MLRPTIRQTLTALFLLLGAALCVAVGVQVAASASEWRATLELARSNIAREVLARVSVALGEERTEVYVGGSGSSGAIAAQAGTDEVLAEARAALDVLNDDGALRGFEAVRSELSALRWTAEGGARLGPGVASDALKAHVLLAYSDLVADALSLRLALLSREDATDPATAAAFQARRYASLLLENLSVNRAILGRLAAEREVGGRAGLLEQANVNGERVALAVELLADQTAFAPATVRSPFESFALVHASGYRPSERRLIQLLADRSAPPRDDLARWEERSRAATQAGFALLDGLFKESRDRIDLRRQSARRVTLLWSGLLFLGVTAVAAGAGTVVRRVVRPLDQLRHSMLALAQGDLDAALPTVTRGDEMSEMADALRVFRANALRRARLQEERLALHERLQDAYRRLRSDIDSAAAVQAALLPAPGRIGGVRFLGRLRPSHLISGDSFDVLRQPNGPVHFFIVDVAGHGAAAALVSVAAHHALTQAVLGRSSGEALSAVAAKLNRDWAASLPYFTMILGELRPEQGSAVLVQAGHPSPLLLRHGDGVDAIGSGGLPIGVLPEAEFDEIRIDFGPGDRLLLFSDGLTEAEDAAGQPFGEQRLRELVLERRVEASEQLLDGISAAAGGWRGSDDPEDDMTMLILEAINDGHDKGIARPRAGADGP
jgi:serine phosphatase RsbU (regulator of sigma subunit)